MSLYKTSFDPTTKIWYGRKRPLLINPEMTLGEACLQMMSRNPKRIVQINVDTGVKYTNEDVKKRAIRTVEFYQRQGLQLDDIVGIVARNSPNLSSIVLASLVCGIPYNCLDIHFEKSVIVHMFGITRPKLVFCDAVDYEKIQSILAELSLTAPIFIIDGNVKGVTNVSEFLETDDESWRDFQCPILGNQHKIPATILCSSGTTGLPKAVVLSQASLAAYGCSEDTICGDTFLSLSSMYWLSGIWTFLMSLLNGNVRLISAKPITPAEIVHTIETYRVTHILCTPPQLAGLVQEPSLTAEKLTTLRSFYTGGSKASTHLLSQTLAFMKNGKFYNLYGLTELGGMCSENGILGNNIEVRIVDEHGENQGKGKHGEILVKSPHYFLEYFRNEEQTRAMRDDDGWFHTGDIGYFDDSGILKVVDRKKDILKYGGIYFAPGEIEDVILQMDEVEDVCVCGVSKEGSDDQLPAAMIRRAKGSAVSTEDIWKFTASRLPDFKRLHGGIYFVDAIPMTASFKHFRNKVKAICEDLYKKNKKID